MEEKKPSSSSQVESNLTFHHKSKWLNCRNCCHYHVSQCSRSTFGVEIKKSFVKVKSYVGWRGRGEHVSVSEPKIATLGCYWKMLTNPDSSFLARKKKKRKESTGKLDHPVGRWLNNWEDGASGCLNRESEDAAWEEIEMFFHRQ